MNNLTVERMHLCCHSKGT